MNELLQTFLIVYTIGISLVAGYMSGQIETINELIDKNRLQYKGESDNESFS